MNDYQIFLKTLKIGEKLLGLHYTDYEDAFSFSIANYSRFSYHLVDYFENHSDMKTGEYEHDLIRYLYIKFIENRIASDLFANTSRGNVCDVFFSPFDIPLKEYPTNLPGYLDRVVNAHQEEGDILATQIIDNIETVLQGESFAAVLNAVGFLGQTVGHRLGNENREYQGFAGTEMLTRNEIYEVAGANFCKWLERNGFSIIETNYLRDSIQNIVAKDKRATFYVLLAVEVAPKEPAFLQMDLDALYEVAQENEAKPYYASISIASRDEEHMKRQIILYGDEIQYRENAFGELEQDD